MTKSDLKLCFKIWLLSNITLETQCFLLCFKCRGMGWEVHMGLVTQLHFACVCSSVCFSHAFFWRLHAFPWCILQCMMDFGFALKMLLVSPRLAGVLGNWLVAEHLGEGPSFWDWVIPSMCLRFPPRFANQVCGMPQICASSVEENRIVDALDRCIIYWRAILLSFCIAALFT